MNANATQALNYLDLGYAVLPLKPGEKRPHPTLVPRGLKEATRDPGKVLAWWREEPAAGIGLLPPEDVLVLDVDRPEAVEELLREHRLGHAPRSRTPRGGAHIFLRLPRWLRNLPASTSRLPGVDLRGMGRAYVVVYPTVLPGGAYRFEVPLKPPALLPLVPTPLAQRLLAQPSRPQAEGPVALPRPVVAQSQPEKRLRALLASYADKVASALPGTRHNTLLRYARAAGGLVPHGLDPEEAFRTLVEAALQAGLPYGEAAATARWGIQRGQREAIPLVDRPLAARR